MSNHPFGENPYRSPEPVVMAELVAKPRKRNHPLLFVLVVGMWIVAIISSVVLYRVLYPA